MPCGPIDQRRAGHRCFRCRHKHTKCDGKRPCSTCARLGFVCTSAAPANSEYSTVHYQPVPKIQNPLVDDSWRYISIFFDAVGSPASRNRVFDFSLIGALSQYHEQVNQTLSTVGSVYASQNSHLLQLPEAKRRDIRQSLVAQKNAIWESTALGCPDQKTTEEFNRLLLCASLLALAELLVDRSGDHWRAWIRHVASFIVRDSTSIDRSDPLLVELIQYFRLNDVLGSLSRRESPLLPSNLLLLRPPPLKPGNTPSSGPELATLLEDLETWAILQCRAQNWMKQESIRSKSLHPIMNLRSNLGGPATIDHRRKLAGLELVLEATALQNRILSILLGTQKSNPSRNVTSSITIFYHWALVGLSQIFRSRVWSSLGCGLPNMEPAMSSTLAMTALDHVTDLLDEVHLEAVFYVPITDHSGIEMKTSEDREKVRNVLRRIRGRGFDVAYSYERDLDLFWMYD